jgi:hypothetical protein
VAEKPTTIVSKDTASNYEEYQMESASGDWSPDDQDVANELRYDRGRERSSRNKQVYHDRSEYNPVDHPGRKERAPRRSNSAPALFSSLIRDG